MAVYRYSALDKTGHSVTGSLEAEDEHALYGALKDRGLLLQKSGAERTLVRHKAKVRPEDLIEFSHQMAFIVESGVPLIQGIADIQGALQESAFRSALEAVIHDLAAGDSLSQAMVRYPAIFSPAYVAVIQAGEASGNLSEAFRDIAHYLEWVLNLRRQIKQALTYPIIVMVIMGIALIIFITYVIPKLVKFIQELNRPMPLPTKMVIALNEFLLGWWPLLLGVVVVAIIAALISMRFERVKFLWDQYKLVLPKVGVLFRDLALVRFVNYLRILYRAGIQIHQSFALLREVIGNRYYRQKLERMRELVLEGESLADAMVRAEGFPPVLERTFRVGEKTGALEASLEQLGGFLDRQLNANVKRFTSLLEPMLLIVVGVVVIFVIISVIWPIYGILGEIG